MKTNRAPLTPEQLDDMAKRLRIKVVKMMQIAGGGHAGGSMSIAEIISVLYFHELRINPSDAGDPDRDRFILSKGHACFTLYAALSEIGYLTDEVLYTPYQVDSPIQAHPELTQCPPGIDMGTGALGQGLSVGVGMAIGARMRKKSFRVYVLLGDGECNEGQVWEAAMAASKYRLDNLTGIVDYNKLSLSGSTDDVMPLEPLAERWSAFGWHVFEVDGHSVSQLIHAFAQARSIRGKPSMIIAHTVKGKGITEYENKAICHAITWTSEQAERALKDLEG